MVQINEPVELLKSDKNRSPDIGVGICLSGGGYRAMLFHLGSLLRLLEFEYLSGKAFGKAWRRLLITPSILWMGQGIVTTPGNLIETNSITVGAKSSGRYCFLSLLSLA